MTAQRRIHIALLHTASSSTVLVHKSGSVLLASNRRPIDNPLWLGLTLLASIVVTACVVVYVRRQTSKLLRQWTCHVTASYCCCCCRQYNRPVASRDINVTSTDVGQYHCRHHHIDVVGWCYLLVMTDVGRLGGVVVRASDL